MPLTRGLLWSAKDESKLLAGKAHSWGVDNRCQGFYVVPQDPVEELLIAVIESRQVDVLVKVVSPVFNVGIDALGLLLLSKYSRWQQSMNPQYLALL